MGAGIAGGKEVAPREVLEFELSNGEFRGAWFLPLLTCRGNFKIGLRGRPHSALGSGIPEPPQAEILAGANRHQIAEGYRVRSTAVLGGLHHVVCITNIAWKRRLLSAVHNFFGPQLAMATLLSCSV